MKDYSKIGQCGGLIERIMYDGLNFPLIRDDKIPVYVIHGWYQVQYPGEQPSFEDCFIENHDLTSIFMDGMEAYISGDVVLGDKKVAEARPLWDEAIKDCGELAKKSKEA